MNKIEAQIDILEADGKECRGLSRPQMTVRKHWNWSNQVVLEFGQTKITVLASDLNEAVKRCTGWRS